MPEALSQDPKLRSEGTVFLLSEVVSGSRQVTDLKKDSHATKSPYFQHAADSLKMSPTFSGCMLRASSSQIVLLLVDVSTACYSQLYVRTLRD